MMLTEFLLARIAEDEAVALAAGDGDNEWEYAACYGGMQIQTVKTSGTLGYEQHLSITRDSEGLSDSVDDLAGPHIARWDPARVLAECEAKRLAIEWAWVAAETIENEWGTGQIAEQMGAKDDNPEELKALALPYADHPDYRQEWKLEPPA
jgi:hypothetical protein